jgi:hypothetical protein
MSEDRATPAGRAADKGLLAVDAGLRCGLARFSLDGRLIWYRSTNFGRTSRLRAGIRSILEADPGLEALAVEGGGRIAGLWAGEAERKGLKVTRLSAEDWRRDLLPALEGAAECKRAALAEARKIIERSGAKRPNSLRHDAAEAILIGLWSVMRETQNDAGLRAGVDKPGKADQKNPSSTSTSDTPCAT